jgi:hypothetical protein
VLEELAGVIILGASVLFPVLLARAALGFIVATLHASKPRSSPSPEANR